MASKKISQLSSSLAPPLSGVTAVVHDGATYKSTLSTLRQVMVDSGSHAFTGSQTISGSLDVSGFITGSRLNLGNGDILDPNNCEALSVHNSGSWNMAAFEGNVDAFLQFYFVNRSPSNNSSTDIVIGNDTGTATGLEEVLFVDLGMNSSTYNGGFVGRENDAYLFNYSKDFFIGTIQLQDNSCDLHFFTNNSWENPQMTISGSGQIGFNTSSITDGYQYEFSGSAKFLNDIDVIGTGSFEKVTVGPGIIGEIPEDPESLHVGSSGSINIAHFRADNQYYSQVNIQNINSSSFASTDLVLTADNGNEILHYANLGINSSTYNGGAVGVANDSYLINAGNDMYIGTLGGTFNPAEVKLFTMGNWINPQVTLHSVDNTVTFNTSSIADGYTYEFSGSLNLLHNINVNGITNLGSTSETIISLNDPTTEYTHDFLSGAIVYVTGATSNITVDIINVPTDNNRGIGLTVMIEQGGTAYMVDSLKINTDDEGPVTIVWSGGSLPAGNINSYDIVSFSILKINGTWKVFGQLTTF